MGKEPPDRQGTGRRGRRFLSGIVAALVGSYVGCSTSSGQDAPCATVCACVKSASQDPNAEKSCLDQCNSATTVSPDKLAACAKNLADTGFPQCTSACKAFAPAVHDLGLCAGYRATSKASCTWDGVRERPNDKACSVTITSGMSGYCDCADGTVPINCGHADGTCELACHNGYFGDFGAGTGGTGGSGGASGDASADTWQGPGGRSYDGGDPCAGYLDSTLYTYACGANLGVDPSQLYLCSAGVTVGHVTCASGCAAAPPGQPNYCYGTDPCVNLPFDGVACGSNLANPAAEQGSLYQCAAGVTLSKGVCPNGCAATTAAQGDYCY